MSTPITPIDLPNCGSWSAPIVLENPADCRPSWPHRPFDEPSDEVQFQIWNEPDDRRLLCYPMRQHLASFRRWRHDAAPHSIDWSAFKVILTRDCGQRRGDLREMNIPDICEVLDHTELPNELEQLAQGLQRAGHLLRRVESLTDRERHPNDIAYWVCFAADLLAKGHGLPQEWTTAGVLGLTNRKRTGTKLERSGVLWFAGAIADLIQMPHPTSAIGVADVLEMMAKRLLSRHSATTSSTVRHGTQEKGSISAGRGIGSGMTWQDAQKAGERYLDTHSGVFPGLNALARFVRCSRATMKKAIGHSTKLKAAKARQEFAKRPMVKASALTDAALDNTAQHSEPGGQTISEDKDQLVALIAEHKADERREARQPERARRRSWL